MNSDYVSFTEKTQKFLENGCDGLQIGDLVCNKTLGPPWMGRIWALMPTNIYCQYSQNTHVIEQWMNQLNNFDPYKQYVALVFVDPPCKHISWDEFKQKANKVIKEEYLQEEYDKIPEGHIFAHPICDLSLYNNYS